MTGEKCELCSKRLLDHKTAETLERISGILKEHELRLAKIDPGRGACSLVGREVINLTGESANRLRRDCAKLLNQRVLKSLLHLKQGKLFLHPSHLNLPQLRASSLPPRVIVKPVLLTNITQLVTFDK